MQIVFEILPKATVSTVMAICFLFAETSGCFRRNRGNFLACEDKVYSTSTFSFVFICIDFIYLGVLPFQPNKYTMSRFVKYDFRFKEQVQMFLFLMGSSVALIVYASAQEIYNFDEWYHPEGLVFGSEFVRSLLYNITQLFMVALMVSVTFQDTRRDENLGSWTGWLRR